MQDPFAPTGVPAGFSHPNQAAAYVAGLERELVAAKAGNDKAYLEEIEESLKAARSVAGGRLGPPSAAEADDNAERDYQTVLKATHVGRPAPATEAEKAAAYVEALKEDLRGNRGTPHEVHIKSELKRAQAALAAIKE